MTRNFYDPVSNQNSSYPWQPSQGYRKYADRNGCEKCGIDSYKIRYVRGSVCVGCLWKKVSDWHNGRSLEDRPEPWVNRIIDGFDFYYANPCDYGPHIAKIRISDGKCLTCLELKKNPRSDARKLGNSTYIPIEPCEKCGTLSPRSVQHDRCMNCRPAKVETPKLPEGVILSRDDAIAFGFKQYRDGNYCKRGHLATRWVSTRNCIECLT